MCCIIPKRITIAPHLSVEELEKLYRQGKDPLERSHYQIIWLLAQGRRTEEVAALPRLQSQLDIRISLGLQPDWTGDTREWSTSESRSQANT